LLEQARLHGDPGIVGPPAAQSAAASVVNEGHCRVHREVIEDPQRGRFIKRDPAVGSGRLPAFCLLYHEAITGAGFSQHRKDFGDQTAHPPFA
jgi:hypothetical protein